MDRDFYQEITEICLEYFVDGEELTIWDLADRAMDIDGLAMHCPPHHYMIPAVLLTVVLKQNGAGLKDLADKLSETKKRAKNVLGGFCGNYGSCGAAVGIGIFTSVYLGATPLTQGSWALANRATGRSLLRIASIDGPRCCKRNTYLAFEEAVMFLEEELGIHIGRRENTVCRYFKRNQECKGKECPFFPKNKAELDSVGAHAQHLERERKNGRAEARKKVQKFLAGYEEPAGTPDPHGSSGQKAQDPQKDSDGGRCECELHPKAIRSRGEDGEWQDGLSSFDGEAKNGEKEIDLYLISGFLGSGKTTLLKRMLTSLEGKKVGVLVNEFGSIGIDGNLVERDGMHLVEISNGSIFCSCLKADFVKTLINFSKLAVDVLLVENSGLADPSGIHALLGELGGKTERNYHYRGAICVVDAVTFLKHVRILTPIQNQIVSSNFILINKIDLVNEDTIEEIRNTVFELNPQAECLETMYSEVPWELFEEKLSDNGYDGETSNHPWNRPASYAIECDGNVTEEGLKSFLRKLPAPLLRGKGFVRMEDSWYLLDCTGEQWGFVPYQPNRKDRMRRTRIVVILDGKGDFKEEVKQLWDRTFGSLAEIYD